MRSGNRHLRRDLPRSVNRFAHCIQGLQLRFQPLENWNINGIVDNQLSHFSQCRFQPTTLIG